MRVPALLTTASAALLLTACVSTFDTEPEPELQFLGAVIQVESFSGGMEGTTVRLYTPGGEWQVIGTLPDDGMNVFELDDPVPGEYRLAAETPDGQVVGSRPFLMEPPGVRWNVTSNAVIDLDWAVRTEDYEKLYPPPPVPRW